jgi:hypothetical protein
VFAPTTDPSPCPPQATRYVCKHGTKRLARMVNDLGTAAGVAAQMCGYVLSWLGDSEVVALLAAACEHIIRRVYHDVKSNLNLAVREKEVLHHYRESSAARAVGARPCRSVRASEILQAAMKREIGAASRRGPPKSATVGRCAALVVGASLIISCGTTAVSDRRVTMIQDPAQEPDPPVIVSLHEVRESDLRDRRKSNREDLTKLMGEPLGQFRDTGYYFASLLGYLEAREVLKLEPPRYADVLKDLVEFHGGGWTLLEPRRETLSALQPDRFSVPQLRRRAHGPASRG